MSEPRILTSDEIAETRALYMDGENQPEDADRDMREVCDSHELLRAENAKLRERVAALSTCHANNCGAMEGDNVCDCH